MTNFVYWLKFYFLGFFSNELSREGASRSFWNVLLSYLLGFAIVCCGLVAGYAASFGVHYKNSDDFRSFLYTVFADSPSDKRINLSVKDGKLSAEIPAGKACVNALPEEDGDYVVKGYKLILDTRPADSAFDDFTLTCKDADGDKIDYKEYLAKSEDDRKSCTVQINYSGKSLDTIANKDTYINYLETEEYDKDTAQAYAGLKEKKDEYSEQFYADEIYKLYVRAYYPILKGKDYYGEAPTLKTYYMNANMYKGVDKYLILLEDVCICRFITSDGVSVDYAGNFDGYTDCVITADEMESSAMRANLDAMIKYTFNSSNGLNFLLYLVSLFKLLPLLAVIMVLVALICYYIYKFKRIEVYGRFAGVFKVESSFLLISSFISFLISIAFSFFLARQTVYIISAVSVVAVMIIRLVVLVIMDIIQNKKQINAEEEKPAEI